MRKTKADLERDLSEARETIRIQNDRINTLQNRVIGRVEEDPYYKAQVESFVISKTMLQEQAATAECQRAKLEDKNRLLQDEIEALRSKLADTEARLQDTVTEKSNRELALEGEVMQLRSEVASIRIEAAKDLEKVKRDRDEGNSIIQQRDRQVTDLRYRLNQANQTIQTMRATLAALDVQEAAGAQAAGYEKAQRGRPARIDGGTRARIRQLHADGMAVREISRREGVSVGMVSKILNE